MQSVIIGGYQEVGVDSAAVCFCISLILAAATFIAVFGAMSPRVKRRIVSVAPQRFQYWYVREWAP
ncbi:hypothetical protein ACH4Q6_08895 [Streptomyces lydicus]|uniref:hypothetical protein n=1 Tax=Streptomyces lydicus TaxID=47763 RepID=UPI00379A108F